MNNSKYCQHYSKQSQSGSALILALFAMIVLLLIGGALLNMQATSSQAIAQEVYGVRALSAAHSAVQAELSHDFPLNLTTSRCDGSVTRYYNNFASAKGLENCRAEVICSKSTFESRDYFNYLSTGICGDDINADNALSAIRSSRSIRVEARTLN